MTYMCPSNYVIWSCGQYSTTIQDTVHHKTFTAWNICKCETLAISLYAIFTLWESTHLWDHVIFFYLKIGWVVGKLYKRLKTLLNLLHCLNIFSGILHHQCTGQAAISHLSCTEILVTNERLIITNMTLNHLLHTLGSYQLVFCTFEKRTFDLL